MCNMKKTRNYLKLALCVIVTELAGGIGAIFTTPEIGGWYANLVKGPLNPPGWVFGPVWTTLFALMGISLWLVLERRPPAVKKNLAIVVFIAQLALNTSWSIIFFGLHNPGVAFFELCGLWLAILATIIIFAKISKPAAWLLLPYILWVSFAGFLNFNLWQLNKTPEAKTRPAPRIETSLPIGYSSENYEVAKVTGVACRLASECVTPMEYLLQSRCPFTSLCLKNICTVVCPQPTAR